MRSQQKTTVATDRSSHWENCGFDCDGTSPPKMCGMRNICWFSLIHSHEWNKWRPILNVQVGLCLLSMHRVEKEANPGCGQSLPKEAKHKGLPVEARIKSAIRLGHLDFSTKNNIYALCIHRCALPLAERTMSNKQPLDFIGRPRNWYHHTQPSKKQFAFRPF